MAARHTLRMAIFALVAGILLLVSGCPAAAPAETAAPEAASEAEGEVVKIGFMAASTGGAAFLGGPERDAALMIKEQLEGQQFDCAGRNATNR